MKIIPAINVNTFEELKKKIKLVEPFTQWIQIDVADGTFTKNTIWHTPTDLLYFQTPLNIEVHLMINNIERRINDWLIPNIKRIIFHLEASKDPDFVIEKCREADKEVGIAVGPDTSWTKLIPYEEKVNIFQILGVYPGLPGQKIQEDTFEKIRHLRKFCKSCIIEIDGGVNKKTAKKAVQAGADILVAANAIFKGDIKKNINELECFGN